MTAKQSFSHLKRSDVWLADPTQLRIIGGAVLPKEERGDLDTEPEPSHALADLARLKRPLDEAFVANITARGVDTPVRIVNLDDVPTVVAGKSRVRAARLANLQRKKDGSPLITVKCVIQRETTSVALLSALVSENSARTDDTFADRLDKLRRLVDMGTSTEDAAVFFAVTPHTIRSWLQFDDQATAELKRAVKSGAVSAAAAGELAKVKDPEKQREALAAVVASPGKTTAKHARKAAKHHGAKVASSGLTKTELRKLIEVARKRESAWWNGVRAGLAAAVEGEVDETLQEELDK